MNDYYTRNNAPETRRPMLHCYDHEKERGCSGPPIKIGEKLGPNATTRIVRLYGPPTPHEFVEMRKGAFSGEWAPFYRCTVCSNERRWG